MIKLISFLILTLSCFQAFSKDDFIQVKSGRFVQHGRPYLFLGTNFWQGMNLASTGPSGNRELLKRELDFMKKNGITQLRILALSQGPDHSPYRVVPAVQQTPEMMDENLLEGLDYLLVEMKKRQMSAVVCLNNFWHWSGGMSQWVSWFEKSSIPYPPPHPGGSWETFQEYASRFYVMPEAIKAQQEGIRKIVSRVNTISGVAYKDDPTIMSWQLANEPRGANRRKAFLQWVSSTAKLIKSIDPKHLISLGSEGETLSAASSGNDFIQDHSIPEIDYATIHIWVENWGVYDPKNPQLTLMNAINIMKDYVEKHMEMAKVLNKPVVFEEFGMARDNRSMDPWSSTNSRDTYYREAFTTALKYMKLNGLMAGINFWAWSGETYPHRPYGSLWRAGDNLTGDPPHEEQGWYGVYQTDTSTLQVIKEFSTKIDHEKKASPRPSKN